MKSLIVDDRRRLCRRPQQVALAVVALAAAVQAAAALAAVLAAAQAAVLAAALSGVGPLFVLGLCGL